MNLPKIDNNLYLDMVNGSPALEQGQVRCRECGKTRKVDSAESLRHGWPKCCGYTMELLSPKATR